MLLFFNTLVKHGHIAPDYRLQNHIRTSFPQRRTDTETSEGRGGGTLFMKTLVDVLKLTPPSHPQAGPIWYIFLSFFFPFGKKKISQTKEIRGVFPVRVHAKMMPMISPWPSVWQAWLLCGDPYPELTSDIPPAHRNGVPTQSWKNGKKNQYNRIWSFSKFALRKLSKEDVKVSRFYSLFCYLKLEIWIPEK